MNATTFGHARSLALLLAGLLSACGSGASAETFTICPGPEAQTQTLTALFEAREGDTIEFCAGRFEFDQGLAIHDKRGIVIKGAGKDQTVLNFRHSEDTEGLYISRMHGLTLEGLTLEDAVQSNVFIDDSEWVTVRNLRTQWSDYDRCDTNPSAAGGCVGNGISGFIMDNPRHTQIEGSEFYGGRTAGMIINQGRDVVLRNNRAEYNVVGLFSVNPTRLLVEDNLLTNNAVGLAVFEVPGARRNGQKNIIRNNRIIANNTDNFAPVGDNTGNLAGGTGMVVLAADQLEVYGNAFSDNHTMGLFIFNAGLPFPAVTDPKYDFYPEGLHIHDNQFRNNGGSPKLPDLRRGLAGALVGLVVAKNLGTAAQIVWDGAVDAPNGCAAVPTDEDGVPLNQPNPNRPREEGRTDERGRPAFQASDPTPPCRWNAWKFDAQGGPIPENRLYIQNNRFESTQLQTLLVDDFVNLKLTTTAMPGMVLDLLVLASNDPAPHAGALTALQPPSLELPFVTQPDPHPSVDEVADACNATQPGEINWNALAHYNCPLLSQYGLFANPADPTHHPNGNGFPYEINSALFSDYASKYRMIFLPPGAKAVYADYEGDPSTRADDSVTRPLQFPTGTVIAKTFAFRKEDADGALLAENAVETRLLIKREIAGDPVWVGMAYIWKETPQGRIAELHPEGGIARVEFDYLDKDHDVVDAQGQRRRYAGSTSRYKIPEAAQCASCHGGSGREAGASPLSPKARYLNRDNACPGFAQPLNQLECMSRMGLLEGLPPDPAAIEKHPRWNVPGDSGSPANSAADVNARTRAYLEINCAHCHTPGGKATSTGMYLDSFRPINEQLGICKTPLSGGIFGGRTYDIVPGHANASILHHRDTSNEVEVRMPQLARSIVNDEASELVARWITEALPALNAENDDQVQNEGPCTGPTAGLPVSLPLPALPIP